MKSRKLFCHACDREVNVMITDAPLLDGPATLRDEEVICLEIGNRCTGAECPLGAVQPDVMVARMIRNGLSLDGLRTVPAACPECGRETELALYGLGRAACTECGSPARWIADHAEPMG